MVCVPLPLSSVFLVTAQLIVWFSPPPPFCSHCLLCTTLVWIKLAFCLHLGPYLINSHLTNMAFYQLLLFYHTQKAIVDLVGSGVQWCASAGNQSESWPTTQPFFSGFLDVPVVVWEKGKVLNLWPAHLQFTFVMCPCFMVTLRDMHSFHTAPSVKQALWWFRVWLKPTKGPCSRAAGLCLFKLPIWLSAL